MKTATEPKMQDDLLSDRERQLILVAARGLSNREIADSLDLSVLTVKSTLYRAYKKLGVNSRYGAILQALKLRLIRIDEVLMEDELVDLLASVGPDLINKAALKALCEY